MQPGLRVAAALSVCALVSGAIVTTMAPAPVNLAGQWQLNRDSSNAPG